MEKKNIVAKTISGYYVPHMWDDTDVRPGLCPICRNVLEQIPNLLYKVRKNKSRDFMGTFDGFLIVSQKFKNFCDENGYEDITFARFFKSPNFYFFCPNRIYPLDYVRMETQFIGYNECCGQYDEVVGWRDFYRRSVDCIKGNDFICRADYFFAAFFNKSPIIVIGTETLEKMIKYGLSGFYCHDVYE